MALADRATQRPESINGTPCSVAALMEALDPQELAAFQLIMYGKKGLTEPDFRYRGWTEKEVFKVVTDEGYAVAKNQINEHRGKRCRCYRRAA